MESPHVVVIGSGPAGLSCAAACRQHGLDVVVLEQGPEVAAVWAERYDAMRLNTSRFISALPGRSFPRSFGLFPGRDQVLGYFQRYGRDHELDVRLGTTVVRVEPDGPRGWMVESDEGVHRADHVVVATGLLRRPVVPAWPGTESFTGRLLHAAEYRNADPYRGRRVVVVGAGSSGMEIAQDLTRGGAEVSLSVRTPPNLLLRTVGGLPGDPLVPLLLRLKPATADRLMAAMRRLTIGNLSSHGLPTPHDGPFVRLERSGASPSGIDRDVLRMVRDGRLPVVPAVEALDPGGVVHADGSRTDADVVLAATGYDTGLEPMVGHLGVLDAHGVPATTSGDESRPGLRFVGYRPEPGLVGRVGQVGAHAARGIADTVSRGSVPPRRH